MNREEIRICIRDCYNKMNSSANLSVFGSDVSRMLSACTFVLGNEGNDAVDENILFEWYYIMMEDILGYTTDEIISVTTNDVMKFANENIE